MAKKFEQPLFSTTITYDGNYLFLDDEAIPVSGSEVKGIVMDHIKDILKNGGGYDDDDDECDDEDDEDED